MKIPQLETFHKLYTEYMGGKMLYWGGLGVIISSPFETLEITILGSGYVVGGILVFQIERLREQVENIE